MASNFILTPRQLLAAANNAMQATLIADGLKRLGRPTLELLMDSRCFVDIWSPRHVIRPGRLLPLRYYRVDNGKRWCLKWCDDGGNDVFLARDSHLYVTVRHAGAADFPLAVQIGAATEIMLANNFYTLLDYRQNEALKRLADDTAPAPKKRKGKKMIIEAMAVKDFKGIKSIRLQNLKPGLIVVTGRNGAGKSSLLDAIEQGLRGGKAVDKKPIRAGATKAEIQFDLGEFEATRTFREGKAPVVKVRNKKSRGTAGQKVLDGLLNARTMDPTNFLNLDDAKQSIELQKALGLDFTAIDADIKAKYDERTLINRDRDNARGAFENMVHHDDAPPAEYSLTDLTGELADMNALKAKLDDADRRTTDALKEVDRAQEEINELEARLKAAHERLETHKEAADAGATDARKHRELYNKCRPIEKIEADIENIEESNQKARDNKAYAKAEAEVERLEKESRNFDAAIADLRAKREKMLTGAECPVKGMQITDEGIYLNSVPLDQCSQAEQLRIGFEVARLINPQLKVICCREGSNLDDDALKFLADLATAHGYQFWIEMVRTDDEDALVIVAGELGNVPDEE